MVGGRDAGRPDQAVIEFQYCDAEGVVSERRVTSFSANASHIVGLDLERLAERTFRRDRILAWRAGEQLLLRAPWLEELSWAAPERHKTQEREICFTGFAAARRAQLEMAASAAGMKVRTVPTEWLDFIVAGPNAGPVKLARAKAIGAEILDEHAFLALSTTFSI